MAKFRPGSRSKLLFLLVYEMAIIYVCAYVLKKDVRQNGMCISFLGMQQATKQLTIMKWNEEEEEAAKKWEQSQHVIVVSIQ